MTTISQKSLRRLARRVIGVLNKHKDNEASIAAFVGSLDQKAKAFAAAYDAVNSDDPGRKQKQLQGRAELEELARLVRMWIPVVQTAIPSLHAATYTGKSGVPDDVLLGAESLLAAVEQHATTSETEPEWREAFVAELQPAIDAVVGAHASHVRRRAGYAELRAEARETALTLYKELIAFRKTLAAAIGKSHPDYRRLLVPTRPAAGEEEEIEGDSEDSATALMSVSVVQETESKGEGVVPDDADAAAE